jgi:Caspase domain
MLRHLPQEGLMRRQALVALVAVMVGASAAPSFAENRVALVIGNGAYEHAPRLPNPANDAADVAAALKRSGFETILATDLNKTAMDEVTIRFARAARTADIALFYYSGHALQFAGVNYLAPIDTRLVDEADLRRMVRLDEILQDLQQAKNLRILVVDACRDNPLAEQLKRSLGTTRALPLQRGLAKIDSPEGMIVAYATQAGRTAEDGDGRNSPYTAAFLKNIEAKDEIGTIFRRISADVYTTTRQTQLPELSLSLIGEFYLNGKVQITVTPAPADPCAAASDHWKSSESIGTIEAYQDHITRFPGCAFAGLAKVRIESLKGKTAAKTPGKSEESTSANNAAPTVSVPTPTPSLIASAESFSAEAVPFVSSQTRAALAKEYARAAPNKALAINMTGYNAFVVAQHDEEAAKTAALEQCKELADAGHSIRKCEIYAIGDKVVFPHGRPPLPQWPWTRHDPSTEKPFVAKDLPLISDAAKASFATTYPQARKPKSIAVSPKGLFYYHADAESVEDATRRTLESCGALAGAACMIVALDDVFVVPVPTTSKATGFFKAATHPSIARNARNGVANKLAEVPFGWNAVAVGASGRPGLGLRATNEANAVSDALADCAKHDSDCHVIAIGPFTVQPN